MALINTKTLEKIEKNRNYVHETVGATYSVFEEDGDKYFQIDTYGKNTREVPGKVSQSFQMDRKAAEYLVELIIEEYNLKLK